MSHELKRYCTDKFKKNCSKNYKCSPNYSLFSTIMTSSGENINFQMSFYQKLRFLNIMEISRVQSGFSVTKPVLSGMFTLLVSGQCSLSRIPSYRILSILVACRPPKYVYSPFQIDLRSNIKVHLRVLIDSSSFCTSTRGSLAESSRLQNLCLTKMTMAKIMDHIAVSVADAVRTYSYCSHLFATLRSSKKNKDS